MDAVEESPKRRRLGKAFLAQFTPAGQRMLRVLADGEAHDRTELHACLRDDLQPVSNIQMHVKDVRKVLRPRGEDVVCELRGYQRLYRWIKHLNGNKKAPPAG